MKTHIRQTFRKELGYYHSEHSVSLLCILKELFLCWIFVQFVVSSCLSYYYPFLVTLCPFILATVLSVLFRFTDSDYPFGIFKLFSQRTPSKNDQTIWQFVSELLLPFLGYSSLCMFLLL
jgi:hypothetical protein